MKPDYPALKFWIDLLVLLVVAANTFYTWWTNREKVTRKKFAEHDKRIGSLETAVTQLPVCANHQRMEENDKELLKRLESIDRGVSNIGGRLDGINRMVDLLTQNELSGGKQQ